jgi:hypothetical protein
VKIPIANLASLVRLGIFGLCGQMNQFLCNAIVSPIGASLVRQMMSLVMKRASSGGQGRCERFASGNASQVRPLRSQIR